MNTRIGKLSEDIEADVNMSVLKEFNEVFQPQFVNNRV